MPKSKFNRISRIIVTDCILWGLLYLAFIKDIEGAYNVIHVIAWVVFAFSFASLSDKMKEALLETPMDLITNINFIDDLLIVCCFIWFGSIGAGVAFLCATLIVWSAKTTAHEEAENKDG